MADPKTRAKKRDMSEAQIATPFASAAKKTPKSTTEQQAAAAEARQLNEANRAAKLKKTVEEQKAEKQRAAPARARYQKDEAWRQPLQGYPRQARV